MKKKIKVDKKRGIVFWVTGLSGVGKTTISKELLPLLNEKFGKTILINGDDLREIFELKNYDKKSRIKYALQYSKLCQFLSNQNLNIIITVVGLFKYIHNWNRKNIKNYTEILIKSELDIIKANDKRKIYKKKKVFGKDIVPQMPANPHISISNDFIKSQNYYANQIFKKINKLY